MSKYEDVHFVDTKQPVWNYYLFTEEAIQNFKNGTHYSLYELFGNKQIEVNYDCKKLLDKTEPFND
jgi:1,4-alpha-glucan branching enzyme